MNARFNHKPDHGCAAILMQDMTLMARMCLTMREDRWDDAIFSVIRKAQLGNAHRKETGRASFEHGNGSINSAMLGTDTAPERRADDPEFMRAMIAVMRQVQKAYAVPRAYSVAAE